MASKLVLKVTVGENSIELEVKSKNQGIELKNQINASEKWLATLTQTKEIE